MIIIGAGLAGCLAGVLDKTAGIYEAGSEESVIGQHRAVLRFRDRKISDATGIPFEKVTVRKQIWYKGLSYNWCPLHLANMYSLKTNGTVSPRSILDLATVERYIAPANFHEQLAERCRGRIYWNEPVRAISREVMSIGGEHSEGCNLDRIGDPILSTVPIEALLRMTGYSHQGEFRSEPISTVQYRIRDCNVNQTIYYPHPNSSQYRATLQGDILTVEYMEHIGVPDTYDVLESFGLVSHAYQYIRNGYQRYGKIIENHRPEMKELLLYLTLRYDVYSLGRFACWRNILMDDVYDDFILIKTMMSLGRFDLIRSTL